MKLKKNIILVILLSLFSYSSYSQDSTAFKPSGKVILRSFFDYSHGIGQKNEESGFDITRALVGYNYKFTKSLQGQVVIDGASGRNSSGNLEVYLRNAFVRWEDKGFTINAGLIGLNQFSIQEKFWKYRYVLKSYQDLNKMGSSVDAGLTAGYKFSPILSADITLINGEGYKKIGKDNSTRYGIGVTANPVKNVTLRAYGDVYNESTDLRDALPSGVSEIKYKDQYTLSFFAGYENGLVAVGAEYNKLFNKGFIEKKDYQGYSFYTSVKIAPKWRAYARYDLTDSSNPSSFTKPWNSLDGQLMIGGLEFQPAKQLKISPNFRNINKDRERSEQYVFVNVEFNM